MILVDLNNLELNVKALSEDGRGLIAVVKNNAYGCGAVRVSKKLEAIGVNYLFVVDYDEATELLENNIKTNIIVHNSISKEYLYLIDKYSNLIPTINDLEDVFLLQKSKAKKIKVHVQVDTKMNRLGFKGEGSFHKAIELLNNDNKFFIEGIYTHFVDSKALGQVERFQEFIGDYSFPMVHCASSRTYPHIKFGNYKRIGLDLYDINQVMTLQAKVINIRKLTKGEYLGYNSAYQATDDVLIAIIPLGYGNGYLRSFKDFKVYASGKFYPIVGRICMNHIFVKVDEDISLDTIFELTSPNLPATELAEYINLSCNHEVYTLFKVRKVEYI